MKMVLYHWTIVGQILNYEMNTKDIARLTNLSPGSIEQYRIKIRKQLNIDRSVNLTEFIDSL